MWWVELIKAVLTFAGTAAGVFAAYKKSAALMAYRLGQLEQKVDRHNKIIERTYALEMKTEVMEERIKVANHRIDDLEKEGKCA